MSDSLRLCGLEATRLLCLWDSPGKNTGMCCNFFLQGIFPTQGLNPHLLHWQADSIRYFPTKILGSSEKGHTCEQEQWDWSQVELGRGPCPSASVSLLAGNSQRISGRIKRTNEWKPTDTYSRKHMQEKMLNAFFHMKIEKKVISMQEYGVEWIFTDEQDRRSRGDIFSGLVVKNLPGNARMQVQILVRELLRFPHVSGQWRLRAELLSLHPGTRESACRNERSRMTQLRPNTAK